jgi:predicted nucleotidyltransferase component of viral defense system
VSPESAVVGREENRDIFAQTIAAAAEQLSIPQLAVEKDYWVCQGLRAIEEHAPGETIFKGGTSLEKQRLIERFSEDIDLLVVDTGFG